MKTDWKQYVRAHLPPLALAAERELEIVEEFAAHLEAAYEDALARGATEAEARARALAHVRDWRVLECEVERAELPVTARMLPALNHSWEAPRRGGFRMETLWQDLRYGLRTLRKQPGFAVLAVLTLALGIGANTGVFSVVHAVLLGALPYERPEQLVLVWSDFQKSGAQRAPAAGVQLREIRARSQTLQDLAGIWVGNGTLAGEPVAEQIKLAQVTANFFAVLGAQPLLGRTFLPAEEGPGGRRALLLSHGLWQRRYGGDPQIIGRAIRMEGSEATVVGVMPPQFQLLFPPDANVPLEVQAWMPFPNDIYDMPRDLYYLRLLGRLKPGVTLAQASAEAPALAAQLRAQYTEYAAENLQLQMVSFRGDAVRELRPALLALFGGAALVLLIACVNVANLLLVRGSARRREMALRAVLGASPGRLLRQLAIESLTLCLLDGALGLFIGMWGLRALLALRPASLSHLSSIGLNWPVFGFAVAATLLAGLLFGLIPALAARRVNLTDALKAGGHGAVGQTRQRTQTLLIFGEIALGFVLLIGAGLLLRTLAQLHKVDPGFQPERVLTFEINLPFQRYARDHDRSQFGQQLTEKLAALPGVESVGAISHLPFDDYPNWYSPYRPESMTETQARGLNADHRAITPGYFNAIGAQLLAGRAFDRQDTAEGRAVVIVDDLLARQTWPNANAIGQKLQCEQFSDQGFQPRWAEVVGVVKHIHHHSLSKQVRGQIYIPHPQSTRNHFSFVVKTAADPLALVAPIRGELGKLDKDLALSKVRPLVDYLGGALAAAKFTAWLAALFGGLALLLALVGIYGVVAYAVSQRTQEMGVRLALGARQRDILVLVLRHGLRPVLGGIVVGVVAAFGVMRFLKHLLFGVNPADPWVFASVALLLVGVAALACWLPARRAAQVDPQVALRCE